MPAREACTQQLCHATCQEFVQNLNDMHHDAVSAQNVLDQISLEVANSLRFSSVIFVQHAFRYLLHHACASPSSSPVCLMDRGL